MHKFGIDFTTCKVSHAKFALLVIPPFWISFRGVNSSRHLPSMRSLSFEKPAWKKVGTQKLLAFDVSSTSVCIYSVTIVLTTLNNVGSTTLFKAVFINPEQVVRFYACIIWYNYLIVHI